MSASNAFETALLRHIFLNEALASVGDAAGLQPSATAGTLFIGLHIDDPGEGGDQTSNETSYTGYTRIGVVRSSAGWVVTGDRANNAAPVEFPEVVAGIDTLTHFSVGAEASGAGLLLFSGLLDTPLTLSEGMVPSFDTMALTVTVD